VGAIGSGLFFDLEGNHTLGRNESRAAKLRDIRDYFKLHIIAHYPAVLLRAGVHAGQFHVLPIGRVGDDEVGRKLVAEMAEAGMDTLGIRSTPGRPTAFGVCFQYPDGSGGNLTTSDSAASTLEPADIDCAFGLLRAPGNRYIALAAPEISIPIRICFLRRASELGALRVVCLTSLDAASAEAGELLKLADLVAMNEEEAAMLVGQPLDLDAPPALMARCAEMLRSLGGRLQAVITAGPRGAYAYDGIQWGFRKAPAVPVASTAGAGDALLGGVLSALAVGVPLVVPGCLDSRESDRPLESALDLGVALASLTVTSPHSIHPDVSVDALASFAARHSLGWSRMLARLSA
jgi:sugar/nucleoside kinase (ribokinase family)